MAPCTLEDFCVSFLSLEAAIAFIASVVFHQITNHSSEIAGGPAVNSLGPPADQESLNIGRLPIDRPASGRHEGHAARACTSIQFSNQQLDCQRIQDQGDKQTAGLCPPAARQTGEDLRAIVAQRRDGADADTRLSFTSMCIFCFVFFPG